MLLLYALLLACDPIGETDSGMEAETCVPTGVEGNPAELGGDTGCGAVWYSDHCATCHGSDGSGTDQGPELPQHVVHHSDLELILVIRGGTGEMPAQPLDAQQTADVLAWLRLTFGEYDPNAP